MPLHCWRVACLYIHPTRPSPRHQKSIQARIPAKLPSRLRKDFVSDACDGNGDVWTADFITPQERKAQQLVPTGPLIPGFLKKQELYRSDEYVEIGFVWKAVGARGEVLLRVCTSLQDYRVGLPGPRYLLPWDGEVSDVANPLATIPQPPLYRARMQHARYRAHNIADVQHNAWQMILQGCRMHAVAQRLQGWRVFMHVKDIAQSDAAGNGAVPKTQLILPKLKKHANKRIVDQMALEALDAEDVRDFRVFVFWPQNTTAGTDAQIPTGKPFQSGDPVDIIHDAGSNFSSIVQDGGIDEEGSCSSEFEPPSWLQGATCIGRITDVYRDSKRFYDTGPYIDVLGYRDLPGQCATFRVAFRKNLVMHEFHVARHSSLDCGGEGDAATEVGGGDSNTHRFVALDGLQQEELLQVENADELRQLGHLSHGATPLWIRNTPSGLLPLIHSCFTHVDFQSEVVLVHPDAQWLRDHMAVRMVKRRPPRRTERQKLSMGGKYRKRVDKAFIRRKGKFARKGRNMRKT